MKRQIALLIVATIWIASLIGCGGKNESINSDITAVPKENDYEPENVSAEITKPLSTFQIALTGENEATFTLTHEAVAELASVQNGDSGQILNSINIYLESNTQDSFIDIDITNHDFTVYEDNPSGEEPLWFCSEVSGDIQPKRDGNTISAKVDHIGIGSVINKYTDYRVEFHTLETGEVKYIEEGKITDIISESKVQATDSLQLVFYDDNTVKFKVFGEEAKKAFYNYEEIMIQLYENSEQQAAAPKLPAIEFKTRSGGSERGSTYAVTYTKESKDGGGDMIYPHDVADGEKDYNNLSIVMDYGVAMRYECDNISDLIGNTSIYELYIGNELICMGHVAEVVIEKEYESIPPIPDVFSTNKEDSKYFVPVTDDYIVAMTTYPTVPICDFGFARGQNGERIYKPVDNHISKVTVMRLISYDEFGIVDEKSKTVYDNEADAMTAFTDHSTQLDASELTGDETMDHPAIVELFEGMDQEGFSDLIRQQQYFGRYGNVRYFCGGESATAGSLNDRFTILENPAYDADGFVTESVQYNYNFEDYHVGHSSVLQDTATLIQYASKPVKDTRNYEEEAAKYNTAPDHWTDHPYASFFPELPKGVTLIYLPDQTINEKNLKLYTGNNGCTREQAAEFIEKLRNIEHKELRYEVVNEDEIQLVLVVEDNILVGAYWRKDEQSLSVYAFKE